MLILARASFRAVRKRKKSDLEDAASWYLACLARQRQADSDFVYAWEKGVLQAYLNLTAPNSTELRYHSSWGVEALEKVVELFGSRPRWKLLDDKHHDPVPTWKGAPFLYLFTDCNQEDTPIRRGDTGESVAPVLLGYPEEGKICYHWYFWKRRYEDLDAVWLDCGKLEVPAYRQLAEPRSELSKEGREVCATIERITGIPTYYYLMRYWGRKRGESARVCPGCGGKWRRRVPSEPKRKFWEFPFRCDPCRLVSRDAPEDNEPRYAKIGEFKGRRQKLVS